LAIDDISIQGRLYLSMHISTAAMPVLSPIERAEIYPDPILEALSIRGGIVCMVGAGGKKSAMYHIAERFPGTVGLTTTTHMSFFRRNQTDATVIAPGLELYDQVLLKKPVRVIGFACPSGKVKRNSGITPDDVMRIHAGAGFNLCLVKADGARGRLIKAPGPHEPVLPPEFSTLIPVVSAHAIGQPLSGQIAHRPERVAAITGILPDELITPLHIARLLTSPDGLLKGAGTATVAPLINMVDNELLLQRARESALQALLLSERFDRVVLTSFNRTGLVEVVSR
jgi:probable selenium-dependent hydroxylase accessory protein YqeC